MTKKLQIWRKTSVCRFKKPSEIKQDKYKEKCTLARDSWSANAKCKKKKKNLECRQSKTIAYLKGNNNMNYSWLLVRKKWMPKDGTTPLENRKKVPEWLGQLNIWISAQVLILG